MVQKKQKSNCYFSLVNSLNSLYIVGILTHVGLKVKWAKILISVFDMIAKTGIKQFNGKCGYPVSLHPGKRLVYGARIYLP